jgi:hypothetical protein
VLSIPVRVLRLWDSSLFPQNHSPQRRRGQGEP